MRETQLEDKGGDLFQKFPLIIVLYIGFRLLL